MSVALKRFNGTSWDDTGFITATEASSTFATKTELSDKINGSLSANYIPTANGSKTLENWSLKTDILPTLNVPRTNLGNPSLYEIGLIDNEFVNKTDFYYTDYPTYTLFETSTDDTTYETTTIDTTKAKRLFGGDSEANITIAGGSYFRITLTCASYRYLNALYLWVTTGGNSLTCKIEKSSGTDNSTWVTVVDYGSTIGSWPGHVILRHSNIAWHPTATSPSYSKYVRLTIKATGTANSTLSKLQWWGGYPYGKRNIFTVDQDKSFTFPVNISASGNIYEGGALLSNKYSPKAGSSSITTLGTIASGSIPYSLITGTPTIPTVNNGTLTIQKNGTSVGTFTANQSGNSTVNIAVPTDYVPTSRTVNGSALSSDININDASIGLSQSTLYSQDNDNISEAFNTIYSDIQSAVAIAGGKTKTYVCSDATNTVLNSQNATVSTTSNLTDTSGTTIALSSLKLGDIILVTETDVPDRWVGGIGTTVVLYKMETSKVDLTSYLPLTAGSSNKITGELYTTNNIVVGGTGTYVSAFIGKFSDVQIQGVSLSNKYSVKLYEHNLTVNWTGNGYMFLKVINSAQSGMTTLANLCSAINGKGKITASGFYSSGTSTTKYEIEAIQHYTSSSFYIYTYPSSSTGGNYQTFTISSIYTITDSVSLLN